MSKKYFDTMSQLLKFMQKEFGFTEDSAKDAVDNLVKYQEEPCKRETLISGWLHDKTKDLYYQLTYLSDYDWGGSNFTLSTTPHKLYKETKIVETTVNVSKPVK